MIGQGGLLTSPENNAELPVTNAAAACGVGATIHVRSSRRTLTDAIGRHIHLAA